MKCVAPAPFKAIWNSFGKVCLAPHPRANHGCNGASALVKQRRFVARSACCQPHPAHASELPVVYSFVAIMGQKNKTMLGPIGSDLGVGGVMPVGPLQDQPPTYIPISGTSRTPPAGPGALGLIPPALRAARPRPPPPPVPPSSLAVPLPPPVSPPRPPPPPVPAPSLPAVASSAVASLPGDHTAATNP